jgi:hypothetical protein
MSGFLNILHRPEECVMLVAFPLTEEQFINDLKPESQKDYAKQEAKKYHFTPHYLWEYDQVPLVKVIEDTCTAVQQRGVTVIQRAMLEDFRNLFGLRVVTPFAHYNRDLEQIELCDRLHPADEIVDAFDSRYSGYCDLSVCNSIILQDKLKAKFGDAVHARASKRTVEIKVHLILYKYLIESLSKKSQNYLVEQIKQRTLFFEYLKTQV